MIRKLQVLLATLLALGMVGISSAHPTLAAGTTVTDCPTSESALQSDITTAGSGGTVSFNCTSPTTISFTSSIAISDSVTLDASSSAAVTFDGQNSTQLFSVNPGISLTLSHLTLQNGSIAGWYGGAIYNGGGTVTITNSTFSGNGNFSGAIYNNSGGTLTITNSTFSGNHAGEGGAIYNNEYGTASITNSTFTGNSAHGGGAIFNVGPMTITNSTFTGNRAMYGGAIDSFEVTTITNSTFANNLAVDYGGAIYEPNGVVQVGGSIIANSTGGGNCFGPITDLGYNLEDDTAATCGFSAANHDIVGQNPELGPLADNGGPTQTMALGTGSSAINVIPAANCPSTDQRGVIRLSSGDTACDIGTYDTGTAAGSGSSTGTATTTTNTASTTDTATTTTTNTATTTTTTDTAATPATQTINFTLPAGFGRFYGDAPFDVGSDASASSNLAVRFSSARPNVCTVSTTGLVTIVSAGVCTINADQGGNSTYNPAPEVQGSFTVNKAPLTITPTHDEIAYGDAAPTGGWGYTAGGFVGGDTAATTTITGSPGGCTTTYTQGTAVGVYPLSCTDTSGMSAANYSFTLTAGSVTVGTRAIAVTGSDAAYTYGNSPPVRYGASVPLGSLVGVDTLQGLGVTCSPVDGTSAPFTPTTTTSAGTYSIVCSGESTSNYSYIYVPGTLTVDPRPITVTANSPASQTYGATSAPSVACTGTGFVSPDAFTLAPTGGVYDATDTSQVTIGSTSPAGGYTTKCSGGSVGSNYTLDVYTPSSFTINPAALKITASSGTMPYGGTVPAITPQYAGFANSDSATSLATAPTCSTVATSGSGVGQYASSCSGATGSNYSISYVAGSVTVNPAPLAVTASSLTMTYGAAILPSLTPLVTGLKNSDSFSGLGGTCGLLTRGTTPTAVTLSRGTPAGTYTVRCSGVSSANYTVSYTDGLLTVSPAQLTITASSGSMTYGGAVPAITPRYSTFAGTDTAASLTTAPSCSTTATSSSNIGQYASTCSGAMDSNYAITSVAGAVQVAPAVLTVNAPSVVVQYSDPVPSLAPRISGYIPGEGSSALTTAPTCTSTVPTGPFTSAAGTTTTGVTSAAGTYAISCSGGSATNYTFDYTSSSHYAPGTLTVSQENATVQMSAAPSAQILGTGPITLSATVRDSAATGYTGKNAEGSTTGTAGDVTKTFVEFDIYNAATCLAGTPLMSPVVSVTSSTRGVGTASYSLAPPTADASYCVVPRIVSGPATAGAATGYGVNGPNTFYTASPGSVTGVAFYTNTGQFVTGGGWIADGTSSTGQGSLSFNARYTKNGGANGQMVYVWQGMYNGQLANFTITSNAISTLTFSGTGPSFTATLQGKCAESIWSVATGQLLSSTGNLTFTATAKDGDYGQSQNVPSDAFSLSVFNGNTTVRQITATPLGGGNLVVHNG